IDLAHRSIFHPWQVADALARIRRTEPYQRGPAVEPHLLQHVDLGRVKVAGDADVRDGEAGTGRKRLNDRIGVAAGNRTVKPCCAEKRGGRHGRGKAWRLHIANADALDHAYGAAEPARQHETSTGPGHAPSRVCGTRPPAAPWPQRKHEASSTIQLNRSPKRCPAWAAISGTSEVGVMPGCVL